MESSLQEFKLKFVFVNTFDICNIYPIFGKNINLCNPSITDQQLTDKFKRTY